MTLDELEKLGKQVSPMPYECRHLIGNVFNVTNIFSARKELILSSISKEEDINCKYIVEVINMLPKLIAVARAAKDIFEESQCDYSGLGKHMDNCIKCRVGKALEELEK